ncbi:hypothetical protein [Flavobacterium aquatile]|uniref:Uncharacterized protein n=1 Tax=Flavobacterium aquatile LMG 4008 = ATCC 11947 TaxID=1453498 RepID=A0A095SY85_9FLAO|nr:hypothetical protein [Flavobacterium aquatile]KGD69522.1 hypothetical protein LG45_01790 [Flavobacterium aquatile LMG 4008 = ATCC 11947]OXA66024.1 hypothetical protein B0A61_12145 [Flavobacterium aquatile LMG 4008 = ATCC 11947]GEC77498.1 hypothetical protein FAQ01_03680 [Flavobacterium aquatile]
MLKFYFLAVTDEIAFLIVDVCLRKLVFNSDFIIINCDCKGIDNKMVLQHLDFRENGILPNPDCNGKLPIFIGTWNGKQENGLEKGTIDYVSTERNSKLDRIEP